MTTYDPNTTPESAAWNSLGEDARVRLIEQAHRRLSLGDPTRDKLHALAHLIVEKQLASGEPAAATLAMERLTAAGVARHDAVHAIGSVMSRAMFEVMSGKAFDLARHAADLARLRPRDWSPGTSPQKGG